jgi:hypothetical protein
MSQEMLGDRLRQTLSRVHSICLIIWKNVRHTGKNVVDTKRFSSITAIFVTNIFRPNTVGVTSRYRSLMESRNWLLSFSFLQTDGRTDEAILIGIPKGCEVLQRMLGMAAHNNTITIKPQPA